MNCEKVKIILLPPKFPDSSVQSALEALIVSIVTTYQQKRPYLFPALLSRPDYIAVTLIYTLCGP